MWLLITAIKTWQQNVMTKWSFLTCQTRALYSAVQWVTTDQAGDLRNWRWQKSFSAVSDSSILWFQWCRLTLKTYRGVKCWAKWMTCWVEEWRKSLSLACALAGLTAEDKCEGHLKQRLINSAIIIAIRIITLWYFNSK